MLDAGVSEQDKVAQYLYNCPEYLESIFAAFKAGQAPINTNYRYLDDELVYLWDNGDVVTVVFHGSFVEHHRDDVAVVPEVRSEEHTSELQSLMRNSYAVFCLKKKTKTK